MLKMMASALKALVFAKGDPEKLLNMMSSGNVGVLSAQCCNPAAVTKDEQLLVNLKQALADTRVDKPVHFETISAAQKSLRKLSGQLDGRQQALVNQLMGLFQTKGLGMFPVVIVDGELVSCGSVPSVEVMAEKLGALKPSRAA